jgi:uncharacterized cupredoxin-like copper-binding protein
MTISLSRNHVAAGQVTFVARNTGSTEHEVVILRRPSSGSLRIVDFQADETNRIGEIEGVLPGHVRRATLSLQPGRYLLICKVPGHYQLGMHAALDVG